MEMIELLWSIIGISLGGIITYAIAKHMLNKDRMIEIAEELLDDMTTNIEMQKKIYTLGVILGNGIRSGVGIGGKGGKFKIEDVIGQGIGMMMQKFLGGSQTETQTQEGENPFAQR